MGIIRSRMSVLLSVAWVAATLTGPSTEPALASTLLWIPEGIYEPLFGVGASDSVSGFYLETTPVTNSEFLAFVEDNPQWRRSQAPRIFADPGYLSHWDADLVLGTGASAHAPVTRVSWFSARAFAKWQNRRLPTWSEWERAAQPEDGPEKDAQSAQILEWYGRPSPEILPDVGSTSQSSLGVSDLHGLVWEWVHDFNTGLVTGESRGDASIDRNLFCGSGAVGAARPEDYATFMRYALRTSLEASYTLPNLGFRCARDKETKDAP